MHWHNGVATNTGKRSEISNGMTAPSKAKAYDGLSNETYTCVKRELEENS